MSGLTPEGFQAKRLPQLKAELESALQQELGDLALSPETVIGQIVGLESDARAQIWGLLADVYASQYPSTASGKNLDRVVSINGITRLGALPTTVRAVAFGTVGTTIPAGSLVENADTGDQYESLASVTIQAANSVGAIIEVGTVADSTTYSVTLDGVTTSITSSVGATADSILTGLASDLTVDTELGDGELTLRYDDEQTIATSANLTITQIANYIDFSAVVAGPTPLPAETLDSVVTPVAGWESVTNRVAGTIGRDQETDAELRIRRERSVRIAATNTLEGIRASLLATDGVTDAAVRQNNTPTTNSDGVPPQHVWAIVQGGEGADIAQVLFDRVAAGIGYFGDETETVFSEATGQNYTIKYDRPVAVPIYIDVTINGSSQLPTDYLSRIRDSLVEYGDQLRIGEDLFYTRLFGPINSTLDDDSFIDDLQVSITSPASGTSNITIASEERAQITSDNIQVSVV